MTSGPRESPTLSTRILLPIVLAFLAVVGVTIGLTLHLVGEAEERVVRAQIEELSHLPTGFFQPESIVQLRFLRDLLGAELSITDARGDSRVSTRPDLEAESASKAYRVIHRPLEGGLTLTAFLPESVIAERKWRLAGPVLAASVVGLLAMGGVAILLARALARSIRRLASSASALAGAPSPKPAPEALPLLGVREIDNLATAFNAVLRELRASQERLVASEKMSLLGRLSTFIAHEVRNPLSAIRMTAQLLQRRSADPRAREGLARILGEIQRLELAVEDLLQTARPSPLSIAPVDLESVVEESVRLVAPQCRHLRVALDVRLAKDLPEVPADAARLKQVVLNLLLNAIEAAGPEGSVEVETLEVHGPDGPRVRLVVRDSGPGVAASVRDRLFEPFVTTKETGAGLGLFVSKQIVEEHAGTLSLGGSPGATEFVVELQSRAVPAAAERA